MTRYSVLSAWRSLKESDDGIVYLRSEVDPVIAKLALLVERCWKDEFNPSTAGPHHKRWLASVTKWDLDDILGRDPTNPAASSVQSKSGAPSPEPAAIPKTNDSVETPDQVCYQLESMGPMSHRIRYLAAKMIRGEGRKVSAAAMNWFRRLLEGTGSSRHPHAAELLCVLSEEGGRQKEGGNETKDIL